jgi:hypothetical protein
MLIEIQQVERNFSERLARTRLVKAVKAVKAASKN